MIKIGLLLAITTLYQKTLGQTSIRLQDSEIYLHFQNLSISGDSVHFTISIENRNQFSVYFCLDNAFLNNCHIRTDWSMLAPDSLTIFWGEEIPTLSDYTYIVLTKLSAKKILKKEICLPLLFFTNFDKMVLSVSFYRPPKNKTIKKGIIKNDEYFKNKTTSYLMIYDHPMFIIPELNEKIR